MTVVGRVLVSLVFASIEFHTMGLASLNIPNLPPEVYVREGDINIGALIPIHRYSEVEYCSRTLRELGALQRVETIVHTLQEINNRSDILPNIELGYVIFDDCSKDTTGLAKVTHFIQSAADNYTCDTNGGRSNKLSTIVPYNVVGIIGTESSSNSIGLAKLLGLFQIPQVSYISTSALLSNKDRFPYFSRLVPPDNFQAQVMIDILVRFGWSYVSVLYSEGGYGGEGYKSLQAAAEKSSARICFAVIREISLTFTDADYDEVIDDLWSVPNARAIVMFTNLAIARSVMAAGTRKNISGQFTFIGSDAWGRNIQDFSGLEDIARGSLTIKILSKDVTAFDEYFGELTPDDVPSNPWFEHFWEDHFNCKIDTINSMSKCASGLKFITDSRYKPETTVSLVRDATYVYAHALHSLIKERCPNATGSEARDCVNGSVLHEYIKRVKFNGTLGPVSFDDNQDGYADYEIGNLQKGPDGIYKLRKVGFWETGRRELVLTQPVIFNPVILKGMDAPKSICSDSCGVHEEQKTRLNDPPCCWTCQKCRGNEITYQDDYVKCTACPDRYKPNKTNYSSCVPIVAGFMEIDHPVAITIYVVTSLLLIFAVTVLAYFIRNRTQKLIKASNQELSYIMLVGIITSYVQPLLSFLKPEDSVCIFIHAGFHLTCTLIYGPLVIKTNRIYRIFDSGRKTAKRPAMIDTKSQLMFASAIIIVQVLVIVLWSALDRRLKAVEVEKEFPVIDLICNIPRGAFIASLSYNVLLVFVSVFYAFKTRKLPNNFNESKHITFCVYTTCVMWLAFLPAYFISRETLFASSVLCCAMVINATVTLACIFCPKIYAIQFVKREDMAIPSTFSNSQTRTGTLLSTVSRIVTSTPRSNNPNNNLTVRPNTTESISCTTTSVSDETQST